MEAAVLLVLLGMFGAMAAGYLVLTRFYARASANRLNMRGDRAVMMAERYMAQAAVARTQLARNHRQLQDLASRLDLSAQELARLNDMKSKFLSMAVHDIRSPLAVIRGFSSILGAKMQGQKEKIQFGNIVTAADQLNRLISDLTDLAMIEAGKLTMQPVPFDLRLIAADIVPGIALRGAEKGIEVLYEDETEPVLVSGDRFRLAQVLMNLMTNALKFTPAGGTIQLRIADEGGLAGVYVKDSGIGVHPSEIKKVFEKFYQAKYQKDANLRKQGWGLGLAISMEIINGHKGELAATSAGLGKGSTFFYKIPLLKG
jgi:signal transduction histidine kinase